MVSDYRSLAIVKDGKIEIDHNKLDIFALTDEDFSGWQPDPAAAVKPYEDVIIGELDIETTGLDADTDQIIMIGIWIHGSGINEILIVKPTVYLNPLDNSKFVAADYEQLLIRNLAAICDTYKVQILTAHNGYEFDYKFILKRCQLLEIPSNFYIDDFLTVLRNTSVNGSPLEFYQPKHLHITLVDTYNLAHQDDFVTRKLNSFSLKSIPLEWKLRTTDRVELSNDEIQECWRIKDLATIEAYLIDDLKDLRLLSDKLLPNYYYQQELLPGLDLQSILNWGNGTKWNWLQRKYYGKNHAVADDKLLFEGSYTNGYSGLFRDVCKVDVSSLYPFIMLAYGITSRKDTKKLLLKILYFLRADRLKWKTIANETGDKVARGKEGYMKIMINSGYGGLATMFKEFNDYVAAASVTAYGRAIAHFLEDELTALGATIVEVDTDGIIYCSTSQTQNKEIYNELVNRLPGNMDLEYEWEYKAIWIPKSSKEGEDGQKKNYIMFAEDGKWKAKGRFVKRDRSVLERTLQGELINQYLSSPSAARAYLSDIRKRIAIGSYPVKNLQLHRLVKRTEVKMPALGFKAGIKHTFWYHQSGVKKTKKSCKPIYDATNKEKYSSVYYLEVIDELLAELPDEVKYALGVE